jgi:hypothetical protein
MSAIGTQAEASAKAGTMGYNAEVARISARTARLQGTAEVERISTKYDRLEGTQVAGYGRAGIDPNSGSALLVRASSRRDEWLDSNNAIWNRETEAVGFENKARDLDAQAKATKKAGNIAMVSTFLTGLGKMATGGGGAGTPLLLGGA